MGKIFDALQKAASDASKKDPGHDVKVKVRSHQEEVHSKSEATIDRMRLTPEADSQALTDTSCEILPMNELLVTCRHDGSPANNFAAEQYRMLRSQILFPPDRPVPKMTMVTSALPREGKSLVASNLAISIASCNRENVLLIDCDLRRPSLARCFAIEPSPGLTDYLQAQDELGNFLHKTLIEKLTLLPAGQSTENPSEILSSQRMTDFLSEIKRDYKDAHIILDSAPVRVAAETVVLSKSADSVLLVVLYGQTPREEIREALESIGKEKFVGVVFNNFAGKYTDKYYYDYYGRTKRKFFSIRPRS